MSRLRRLPVLLAISAFSLVAMTFGPGAQQNAAERLRGTIAVDVAKTGPRIPANLYGIFYEEINHAGDGGLYAELVQNRGFEDANLPPACVLENGFVVPPRTPHFDTGRPSTWRLRWDATNPHPAWRLDATAGSEATIALTADQPLNDASPHSLEIAVSRIATDGRVRVVNDGYWGMAVTGGDDYRLRFFARSEDTFRGPITASIEGEDGTAIVSRAFTERPGARWRLYEATLRPARTDARARLVLQMGSPGRVWLDFVSLFPARTFKNRPNGLRPALATRVPWTGSPCGNRAERRDLLCGDADRRAGARGDGPHALVTKGRIRRFRRFRRFQPSFGNFSRTGAVARAGHKAGPSG